MKKLDDIINNLSIEQSSNYIMKKQVRELFKLSTTTILKDEELKAIENKIVHGKIYVIKEEHDLDKYEKEEAKEFIENLQNIRN